MGYFMILILTLVGLANAVTDYSAYRQPDDIDSGKYDDFPKNPSHICARTCGGPPKTCYYSFEVETYSAMGSACANCPRNKTDCYRDQCIPGDGFRKSVTVANRRYPSPSIQVCYNDTIIVDVHNSMIGKYTTLHWHGLYQKGTPWMDGVYMVTQCPIATGQSFRYKFTADKPGTHYWHDHSGLTKIDGLQSSIVVRDVPKPYNNMDKYDYDKPSHTLFITDWKHFISDADMPDTQPLNNDKVVDSFLINGKGIYIDNKYGNISPLKHYKSAALKTPLYETVLKPGKRYRFRIVGGTCMACGINFSVAKHKLLIIASDGAPLNTSVTGEVDSLNVFAGERYDVVIKANQAVKNYWMIVKGVGYGGECKKTYQVGIIRYKGSGTGLPGSLTIPSNPVRVNTITGECKKEREICVSQLRHMLAPPNEINNYQNNNLQLIQLGFYLYNLGGENGVPRTETVFKKDEYLPFVEPLPNEQKRALINNITFLEPSSPLLTQYEDIPASSFCSEECKTYKKPRNCICLDLAVVSINEVVDLIITDTNSNDKLSHPFHLHGHEFYVLEMGILGKNYDKALEGIMTRVKAGKIQVNNPPAKDSIVLMNGGYAVVRLIADNPGMWLMHCHFLHHHINGMTKILQIGDINDFPSPPNHFPQCYNFYDE